MGTRLSTAYFPSVLWAAVAVQSTDVCLEAHENFQKQSYRNRCHIYGPHGLQKLSYPVRKGAKSIREIRVSLTEPWQHDHLKAIETAYRNAPFFEVLFPDVEAVLLRNHATLWELNYATIGLYEHWLEQPLVHRLCETFVAPEPTTLTGHLTYTSEGIDGRWLHPKAEPQISFPPYGQVFATKHNFLENLSALDLFFNLGRSAWDYLADLRF